jgi:RimJ/RimL family protein N-acetyltransferase
MQGAYVRLEPVDVAAHAESLYRLSHARPEDAVLWTYLAYGPFADQGAFERWLAERSRSEDPLFFALIEQASGQASGMASYLNIVPANGCLEIGHIWFVPPLQKTRAATETIFLMMRQVFDDLGYRRLEWKCDALNAAARRAPLRLHLRGHLPPAHGGQGPQSRYRLVRHARPRVARDARRLRALAGAREFRRRRSPAYIALGADAPGLSDLRRSARPAILWT